MPGNIVNLSPADIAKWPKPNYIDPERREWMPEYAGVLYGVATLMTATRLWLRCKKQAGGLGFDDALLICAWLSLSWFTALSIVGSEMYYTSRHMWDIPPLGYENMAKVTWIAELAFLITGCCVKVSVLLFYRRLVANTVSRYWIWAVIFAIVFTISYSLAFILALVFNCMPTEAYWRAFSPTYHHKYTCADTTIINLLAGIMAAFSDLYSVALPCIMTSNLQLPRPQKIALYLIFSLGLLAVGASGVRTYYMYKVGHTSDVSTCIFNVFVWSQLELSLGMMCAALPSLRVLFRNYLSGPLSKLKRSVTSSRNRRDSDVEQVIIRHVETPDLERSDFAVKHMSDSTAETGPSPVEEPEATEQKTWSGLVRSPADYESYNLQNMEKYRQSAHARQSSQWSRSTKSIGSGKELHDSGRTWLDTRGS